MRDPELVKGIREGREDIKAGRLYSKEEVFVEPHGLTPGVPLFPGLHLWGGILTRTASSTPLQTWRSGVRGKARKKHRAPKTVEKNLK